MEHCERAEGIKHFRALRNEHDRKAEMPTACQQPEILTLARIEQFARLVNEYVRVINIGASEVFKKLPLVVKHYRIFRPSAVFRFCTYRVKNDHVLSLVRNRLRDAVRKRGFS
jgi:hypothetical protein